MATNRHWYQRSEGVWEEEFKQVWCEDAFKKAYFPLTINLPFCEVTNSEASLLTRVVVGEAAKTTHAAKSSCQS